jgi:hypothetical protein
MPRPQDSYAPRVLSRRRYTDTHLLRGLFRSVPGLEQSIRDVQVDSALQGVLNDILNGIMRIQSSMPVNIHDYDIEAGTGLKDDSFSIQVALDKLGEAGGGLLQFPPGDFYLGTGLVFNFGNTAIGGEGYSTRFWTDVAGLTMLSTVAGNEYNSIFDCHMEIEGGVAGTAIEFIDQLDGVIQGVTFENFTDCIVLSSCLGMDVSHNNDENTSGSTVTIDDAGAGISDRILVQQNDFSANTTGNTYSTTIPAGGRRIQLKDNLSIPIPTQAVSGLLQTFPRDPIFGAPDRFIGVSGTAGTTVQTIETTYAGDWRVFVFVDANVLFLDAGAGNIHLSGGNFGGGGGQLDLLTLFCSGPDWVEMSRSPN